MRVSVILPCYQAQVYLPDCLYSLQSQDFHGLEILCVDDGSTDATGEVLTSAATNDSRVRVWRTENRGVAAARALGIEKARGDYVLFVDADDLLTDRAIERLYETACAQRADILSADHEELDEKGLMRQVTLPEGGRDAGAVLGSLVRLEGLYNNQCNKLISRRLFTEHGIRPTPDVSLGEDVLLNLALYRAAERFDHLEESTYIYRRHAASATRSRTLPFDDHLPMLAAMGDWLRREALWAEYYRDYTYTGMWLLEKQWGVRGALRAYPEQLLPLLKDPPEDPENRPLRRLRTLERLRLFRAHYLAVHALRRLRGQNPRQG